MATMDANLPALGCAWRLTEDAGVPMRRLAPIALFAFLGQTSPEFTDTAGRVQTPLAQPDRKATVLLFVMPDCPISNSYAPEICRIVADFEPKKIAFFLVHPDPDVTAEQAKAHAKEYGYTCPVLRDPTHLLVKKAGVTTAPEVAILAPDGKLAYRGRIDDWYFGVGKRRGEPTRRDLRDALDAIVRGVAVPNPTTKAIGCPLPDPKE
jgi:AhpC/TSA family